MHDELVQVEAWCHLENKPLPESVLTMAANTRPQWVKFSSFTITIQEFLDNSQYYLSLYPVTWTNVLCQPRSQYKVKQSKDGQWIGIDCFGSILSNRYWSICYMRGYHPHLHWSILCPSHGACNASWGHSAMQTVFHSQGTWMLFLRGNVACVYGCRPQMTWIHTGYMYWWLSLGSEYTDFDLASSSFAEILEIREESQCQ